MSANVIQISVALVTRNRPDSLERTLKSLRAQSVQPFEVVVSDDSDAAFAGDVARVAEKYDCRYINGPQLGLYANRNHVVPACRGTHIRTMDDDHEFPVDHFALCHAACLEDPNSTWIIGEFLPGQDVSARPMPCPGQLHPRGFSVAPADRQRSWAISDGASIYPRSIFDQGLRYIDDYKFGDAYLEFGSRLYWLGHRIRHLDTTYVLHHYDPGARSFLNLDIDMSARFCAIFCHSFIYQPSARNQVLSCLEVLKQTLLHTSVATNAFRAGLRGFQKQRDLVSRPRGKATAFRSATVEPVSDENYI